jgi:amino acid transporter
MMKKEMTALGLIAATYFMVSGGPYGLEDLIAQTGYGLGILILCLVPFLWALPTALMVGELASAIPDTGGFYVWVKRALGKFWGFQEVWLSLAASVFDLGIYPLLFTSYLGVLAPSLVAGWHGAAIATALVLACLGWNIRGAKSVGDGSIGLGALMVSPFAILAAVGLWHAHTAVNLPVHHANGALMGGILVAMWNFMGWDQASTIASDVENPQKTYPKAMFWTLVAICVSYIVPIAAAWWFGIPLSAWSTGSWAAVGGAIAGPLVRDAIVIGGMISSAGMLLSLLMSYSRLPVAMAEDGFLPKVFEKLNAFALPLIGIFACSTVWATAFGLNFNRLVMLDILLYGSSLVLEFVSLAVLRWKEPNLERPFRVPGGKVGAVLVGVCPTVLLALAGIYGDHSGILLGIGTAVAGGAVYYAIRAWQHLTKPALKPIAAVSGD